MLDEQKIVCVRCGFTEFVHPEKRKRKDELCADCRVRPAKTINYGLSKSCKPWHGEYDECDRPVLGGHVFLPGERKCGHGDCVEVTHILS